MTIVFVDTPQGNTEVRAACPACGESLPVRLDPGTTRREICPHCDALFTVRLYHSGMAVID